MWTMFAFGFGAMFFLTQMYGLGLNTWTKRSLAIGFIVLITAYYALAGNLGRLNEVIRIPMIDYIFIFLLYGIYLGFNWLINLFKRPEPVQASTD